MFVIGFVIGELEMHHSLWLGSLIDWRCSLLVLIEFTKAFCKLQIQTWHYYDGNHIGRSRNATHNILHHLLRFLREIGLPLLREMLPFVTWV